MNVLHLAPLIPGRQSGLNVAIPALAAAQNSVEGVSARLILTGKRPDEALAAALPSGLDWAHWTELLRKGRLSAFVRHPRPDLIVAHSTYIPLHAVALEVARVARVPFIVTPHGGLTAEAQRIRRRKKQLGNVLFLDRILRHAAGLHFLSAREVESSRGRHLQHFVLGNGTAVPSVHRVGFRRSALRFVFLGRVAIWHKGLDLLVRACAGASETLRSSGARVRIYGDGEIGALKKLIDDAGVGDLVTVEGPVQGAAKKAALLDADVFVHTSRFEGHPMSVLEALAFGVPCVLTPGTGMAAALTAEGAGWAVAEDPRAIASRLAELCCGPDGIETAGSRARAYVTRHYSWEWIAAESIAQYRRLVAGGPP